MGQEASIIRSMQTKFWAKRVLRSADERTFYSLAKWIEGENESGNEPSNIWYKYASGKRHPTLKTIIQVEGKVSGSRKDFMLPLWEILAFQSDDIYQAELLFGIIPPYIAKSVVLDRFTPLPPTGTRLYEVETRCDVDALACLTLLLRYWYLKNEPKHLYKIACSIYRVLLVLEPFFYMYGIRDELLKYYERNVFSLINNSEFKICFSLENYVELSARLYKLRNFVESFWEPSREEMLNAIDFLRLCPLGKLPRGINTESGQCTNELLDEIAYERGERQRLMKDL